MCSTTSDTLTNDAVLSYYFYKFILTNIFYLKPKYSSRYFCPKRRTVVVHDSIIRMRSVPYCSGCRLGHRRSGSQRSIYQIIFVKIEIVEDDFPKVSFEPNTDDVATYNKAAPPVFMPKCVKSKS